MIFPWLDWVGRCGFDQGGPDTPVASFSQCASNCKEGVMETKDLKKFLAGFGIASLLAGVGLAASATKATGASG